MSCKDCPIRKYYAKAFDIHFDEKDCICKCPYGTKQKNDLKE